MNNSQEVAHKRCMARCSLALWDLAKAIYLNVIKKQICIRIVKDIEMSKSIRMYKTLQIEKKKKKKKM